MFKNDFILRQIEMMGGAVRRIFKKEEKKHDFELSFETSLIDNDFCQTLENWVESNDICHAENELFKYCKIYPTQESLQIAIDFYALLNQKTDMELLQGDFSREEISIGINDIMHTIFNDDNF